LTTSAQSMRATVTSTAAASVQGATAAARRLRRCSSQPAQVRRIAAISIGPPTAPKAT
jgi:hypothetical protein